MSIGAQLRASREARGLTIDALAHTTRVQPRILAAIERDDVGAVPPRPFGRGFVRAYAREMGLDGDQTARDYFAQFAPVAPPPDDEPSAQGKPATERSRSWIVVVSAGLAAGLALALVVSRPARIGSPRPTPAAAAIIGTSGASTPSSSPAAGDATSAVATPTASAPPAEPTPLAPPAPLTIVLVASRPSWVTADADGRRALYRTVMPGSPETVTATREIVIRVGDAGALAWRVNGREVGSMGRPGQVRDLTITPRTAATIH